MKKVGLYYFVNPKNYGDLLNVVLLEEIFKLKPNLGRIQLAELVMLGSLLDEFMVPKNAKNDIIRFLLPKIKVFGTGFIREPKYDSERFFREVDIYALRGKITKSRAENVLGRKIDVPLGDPALLLPRIVKTKPSPKYDLGIVAHYADKNHPEIKRIQSLVPNSIILDIHMPDPIAFTNLLLSCERILSSAMHPLIVADAFGVPNQRMILSDLMAKAKYKFDDYYSVYTRPNISSIDLRSSKFDATTLTQQSLWETGISAGEVEDIAENLFNAFPIF